jgi:hypothetical protein
MKLSQLEAAKALLLLRETIVKEEKQKLANEKRVDTIREKKVQEPLRRSKRVQQIRKRETMKQVD